MEARRNGPGSAPPRGGAQQRPARGPAARAPKESPEELLKKVQALEAQKKEDTKEKKKEEAERKKQLQAAKKKLNTEIALTKSDVRKQDMAINKLQTTLTRLDAAKDSTANKKTTQMQKMDQLIRKSEEKHTDTESQLAEKMSKVGLAKGRLSHLEFAQAMLEKGVIIDITSPDPQFQPAAIQDKDRSTGASGSRLLALESGEPLPTDVVTLHEELGRLHAENEALKAKLIETGGVQMTSLASDDPGLETIGGTSEVGGAAPVQTLGTSSQASPMASACSSHVDITGRQQPSRLTSAGLASNQGGGLLGTSVSPGLASAGTDLGGVASIGGAAAGAVAGAPGAPGAAGVAGAGGVAGPGGIPGMADFGAGEVPVGTVGPITGGKDGEPLRRVIRGPTRAYSMPPGPGGGGGGAGGASYDGRSPSPTMMGAAPGGPGFLPGAGMLAPGFMGGRFPSLGGAGGLGRPIAIPLRPGSAGMASLPSFFDQRSMTSPRPFLVPAAAMCAGYPAGAGYPPPAGAGYGAAAAAAAAAATATDPQAQTQPGGLPPQKCGSAVWSGGLAAAGGAMSYRGGMADISSTPTMTSRAHLVEPRVPSPAGMRPGMPGSAPYEPVAGGAAAHQFTPRSGLSDTWLLRPPHGGASDASFLTSAEYQFPGSTTASTAAGAATADVGSSGAVGTPDMKDKRKGANHFRKVVHEVTGRALREFRMRQGSLGQGSLGQGSLETAA